MSAGSTINGFTTKEVKAIYTYLDGSSKPFSSGKALSILMNYAPVLTPNPNGPNDFYISTQFDVFFNNLKGQYIKKFEKQKFDDFETLKNTAINYCEEYDISID